MFGFKKKQPEKFVESVGISVEEEGFTKLTGDKDRSLSSLTQERMQELAVFLWKSNPLANRIIEFMPDGTIIDKVTTYDEYLASDAMARKRTVYTANREEDDN